ncbi:MAG: tRNA (adenosine(37)-N6)-threonylcarbamoyltransferase complex transferase subunit TsaD [Acidimicrobiia bacterium]|nr:tRNA (adenosine(37)-N6)-threonylcarbamoyltransferase complex transferase subunit TsaD [Acidimicrobiia bacterium]MDH4362709.1 tRNA (adenosine(37)-N6)-threonylcarbamoyltransferase complex transferase subunit TsaD [Acidimicrobiia bacterium]MDH5288741.1 tRNA (adenosine(37)-N6)-threonylcarbamoyltransferase complex transferase subunit TsaD [Acidimicrobiia bacterium]
MEMTSTTILAIETSCDETSAAVVRAERPIGAGAGNGGAPPRIEVLSNVVSSQVTVHAEFGGVVPEVASRAHLEMLEPVVGQALADAGLAFGGTGTGRRPAVDAVAATRGPGLIGALLVGVSSAKALALAWDVPYVGVNHMEGHLFATFLERPDIGLPLVVLLVSGGHTMIVKVDEPGRYRILGSTVDDAAGEAFDKVARYLGFGYPGGPIIDALSAEGDPAAIRFPRGMLDDGLDFSFSGMKTAVINYVRRHPEATNPDLAASFQEAVVDVLVTKVLRAAKRHRAAAVALGGGVAANSRLRQRFAQAAAEAGLDHLVPSRAYCTDNAAMIAAAAHWRLAHDGATGLDAGADPSLRLATL